MSCSLINQGCCGAWRHMYPQLHLLNSKSYSFCFSATCEIKSCQKMLTELEQRVVLIYYAFPHLYLLLPFSGSFHTLHYRDDVPKSAPPHWPRLCGSEGCWQHSLSDAASSKVRKIHEFILLLGHLQSLWYQMCAGMQTGPLSKSWRNSEISLPLWSLLL